MSDEIATAPDPNTTADSLPAANDAEIASILGVPSDSLNEGPRTPVKPAAETKPAATPEVKPAATPTQEPTPSDPIAKLAAAKADKDRRNLDGLDPEWQETLRSMSNKAYNKIRPLVDKFLSGDLSSEKTAELEKRLKEAEDRRWHDHPDSYKLTEEYQQASEMYNLATAVAQHWEHQLIALDGGAKQVSLLTTDAQGNVVVAAPTAVTPATRADLVRRMAIAQQDISQVEQQREGIKATHQQRYKNFKSTLENIYNTHFGKHEALFKDRRDTHIASFPSWWRNTPEAKLLATSLATNELFQQHIDGLAKADQASALVKGAASAAGPTVGEINQSTVPADPNKRPVAPPSEDEFKMVMSKYGI